MSSTAAPSQEVLDLVRYSYDGNKAFSGITLATTSPLEPGIAHEPAFSTSVKPPAFSGKNVAVYDESTQTWAVVPDYRNDVWYDGSSPVVIDKPGDPAKFTPPLTANPPTPADTNPSDLDLSQPPGLTFDQQKARTNAALLGLINITAAQFTSNYSQNEVLSWTAKEAAARLYLAKQPLTDTQNSLLSSEYQAGGNVGTMEDLCNSIVFRANILAQVTGFLAGTRSETQTAIQNALTTSDLMVAYNNAKTKITAQIAQIKNAATAPATSASTSSSSSTSSASTASTSTANS